MVYIGVPPLTTHTFYIYCVDYVIVEKVHKNKTYSYIKHKKTRKNKVNKVKWIDKESVKEMKNRNVHIPQYNNVYYMVYIIIQKKRKYKRQA